MPEFDTLPPDPDASLGAQPDYSHADADADEAVAEDVQPEADGIESPAPRTRGSGTSSTHIPGSSAK